MFLEKYETPFLELGEFLDDLFDLRLGDALYGTIELNVLTGSKIIEQYIVLRADTKVSADL